MTKFLVTFTEHIEDVIEVSGFSIMTEKEVLRFEELANSITWPFTYTYNDGTELYYTSGDDFLSSITFKEITSDEANMFSKLFNNNFGTFLGEGFLSNIIDEDNNEEDDNNEDDLDFHYEY